MTRSFGKMRLLRVAICAAAVALFGSVSLASPAGATQIVELVEENAVTVIIVDRGVSTSPPGLTCTTLAHRLYNDFLGRKPEQSGLERARRICGETVVNGGVVEFYNTLGDEFARSTESRRNIEDIYRACLYRSAGDSEIDWWVGALASTEHRTTIADVASEIANSPEARDKGSRCEVITSDYRISITS